MRAVSQIDSIDIGPSGKVVQVSCELVKEGAVLVNIVSQFLIRGRFSTSENTTFMRKQCETFMVKLPSAKAVSVLASKPWFSLDNEDIDLLGTELLFNLQTVRHNQLTSISSVILQQSVRGDTIPLASVRYSGVTKGDNPIMSYLSRWGQPLRAVQMLERPITIPCNEKVTVPVSNVPYSRASGDSNPIHTDPMFAAYAGLPGTIAHGMFCPAQTRYVVERYAAEGRAQGITNYKVSFVGMVLPGDVLVFSLPHIGMLDGLKVIRMEVRKREISGEKVLEGEVCIRQPPTAVVFTGQGSQEKSMGMDLYERSPVARDIWDRCDNYFESQFGVRLSAIVRENPSEVTVHFGGLRGRILRQNYMAMACDVPDGNGATRRQRLYPDIEENTPSYRHSYPDGLLFATQFAQPALTVMEIASFKDVMARGLIPPDARFAGHSLGEYAALAALTDFMPLDGLLYVVFCRGLTMQAAVERDARNRSGFGMVAVDPNRVSGSTFPSPFLILPMSIKIMETLESD